MKTPKLPAFPIAPTLPDIGKALEKLENDLRTLGAARQSAQANAIRVAIAQFHAINAYEARVR